MIGENNREHGERISTRGDQADSFYITRSGEVRVMFTKKTETNRVPGSRRLGWPPATRGGTLESLHWSPANPEGFLGAVGNVTCFVHGCSSI